MAAIPLLAVGLLLSWAALPGWIELVMMWPNRVGGIAATCAEAFRPYSPVLANLAGMAYWWGWIPTCGLTAILSASALHQLYLPGVPVSLLATLIVVLFTGVNLAGVKWAAKVAIPIAIASAALALLSSVLPMLSGSMDWGRGLSFHLETPFGGFFGALTSAMACVSSTEESSGGIRNVPGVAMRVSRVEFVSEPGLITRLLASLLLTSGPLMRPAAAVGVVMRASQSALAELPG